MRIPQISLLLALLLFPTHVLAQVCGPTSDMLEVLKTYPNLEKQEFLGFTSNNDMAQLTVNEATGSWSFIVSYPNGRTCYFFIGPSYLRLHDEEGPSSAPRRETRKGT